MPAKRITAPIRRSAELPHQIEGPPEHARIEGLYVPQITAPPTKVKDIKTGTLRGTVLSVLSRHHTNGKLSDKKYNLRKNYKCF